MLEVFCKGSCTTLSNISCNVTTCTWNNKSESCEDAVSDEFTTTSWIGIILALIGNVVIK
jgi:hypothetical protein